MSHPSLDFARDFFQTMNDFFDNFNVQTTYGPRAGAIASSFIISGVGFVLIYVFTQRIKKKNPQFVFTRSISMGALHGGKLAMKRLLQYQKMRANPENKDKYLDKLEKMINSDSPDFQKLQGLVAKLEMVGQEDKAIEKLKIVAEKADKEKSLPLYEYEYQMLLVESLIYKGNIKEAEKVPCLNKDEPSDVRRSLYKAIIQILGRDMKKAREEWEELKKMRSQFLLPPDVNESQFLPLLSNFESFQQVVELLRKDIFQKPKAK